MKIIVIAVVINNREKTGRNIARYTEKNYYLLESYRACIIVLSINYTLKEFLRHHQYFEEER